MINTRLAHAVSIKKALTLAQAQPQPEQEPDKAAKPTPPSSDRVI
jgi:hypothetical protein